MTAAGGAIERVSDEVSSLLAACMANEASRPPHAFLYSARELEFIRTVDQQRLITAAQLEWLRKLAEREHLDFGAINSTALAVLLPICQRWLPDGVVYGNEFVARNPLRADGNHGSFRINLNTGKWADFALSDARGGDPVSLAAYLFHAGDQIAAAKDVKRMVGL